MKNSKLRYYEVGEVIRIGGGSFRVFDNSDRYDSYYHCTNCHLRGSKSCSKLACHASDRIDGNNVQFVSL